MYLSLLLRAFPSLTSLPSHFFIVVVGTVVVVVVVAIVIFDLDS